MNREDKLKLSAEAGFIHADHTRPEDRREAAERLQAARISLESARAFSRLAWEMKFMSGPVMSDLDHRLEELAQQAASRRGWFGKR